ncbi:MAG: 4Fe-4S dicluster domain-containing protein [Desulfurococcaceae archaeon]|uniref:4Fe-4S dicluster domain-containing protein n=1 Tax=Staphylothermus marinus TaxID=2280 RepID=A0A7C4NP86_STAMA
MNGFIDRLTSISGRNPYLCHQCGTCSAVCPMAEYMDIPPHQVLRLVQLGSEKVLKVNAIWMCVACMTCVDRCPRNVGPGILLDALRSINLRRGVERIGYDKLKGIENAPVMALVAFSKKMSG